ncbi:MAG: hypothetical protein FWF69_02050 [Firmicutes bacterium]|nr:hypothetical protein [Bacillota bacterium]
MLITGMRRYRQMVAFVLVVLMVLAGAPMASAGSNSLAVVNNPNPAD